MFSFLRFLRHGPLRKWNKAWLFLGNIYRAIIRKIPYFSVKQKIGSYGPFKLHPEFTFSNFENWGSKHNKGFKACIEACRDKQCVIDVGAHIGLVSLPASTVLHAKGKVYAFEPSTVNRDLLQFHVKKNSIKNIIVRPELIGEGDNAVRMLYECTVASGMNSVACPPKKGNFTSTQCIQTSLDSFCDKGKMLPEVIKIDVEGAEIEVLKGAKHIINKCKPIIFLSIHPKHIVQLGHTLDELKKTIQSLQYEIKTMDGLLATAFHLDEYILTPIH